MILPNFLADPGFLSLKRRMGIPDDAVGILHGEVKMPYITPEEWRKLEGGGGLEVDLSDITILPDGTLGFKESRILVYIYQPSQNPNYEIALPKYHIRSCQKIKEMWANDRKDRYVVSTKNSGEFTLRFKHGANWKDETHRLDVCRFCLGELNYQNYLDLKKNERDSIVANFTPSDFFRLFPKKHNFVITPPHTDINPPEPDDYPKDWYLRSRQAKESSGWKCQSPGCGRILKDGDSRFLHVHHRNGKKRDCRPSNLEVLCLEHHAEQFQHAHMKATSDYQAFIRRFKKTDSKLDSFTKTEGGDRDFFSKLCGRTLRNIENYLPDGFESVVERILTDCPSLVYVTAKRKSKHGDHKRSACKRYSIITINHNDNHYRFVITLLHELAHAKAHIKHGPRVQSHGVEWKELFSELLTECTNKKLFPEELLSHVRKHAQSPLYSSSADQELEMALRKHDLPDDRPTVGEIPRGTKFSLDGKEVLIKGETLRKRVRCKSLSGKSYTVSKVARVHFIQ